MNTERNQFFYSEPQKTKISGAFQYSLSKHFEIINILGIVVLGMDILGMVVLGPVHSRLGLF
jgi:hypothetical protein